jgi:hypothetical protein
MCNLRSHQLPRPQLCKQRTRFPINLGQIQAADLGIRRRFVISRVVQSRLYMLCQALCDLRSEKRRNRGSG